MVIIIVSIIALIFIAFTTVLWVFGGELFFMAPDHNKMDRFLKTNINTLSYVADALSDLDYDSIIIRKNPLREEDKYNMNVSKDIFYHGIPNGSDRKTMPIPDELLDYVKTLYESGVRVISCDSGSVYFSIWAFMDEIRGIAYCRTWKLSDNPKLIEVRQLSKENWYYYVDNFEKAKALNHSLFP